MTTGKHSTRSRFGQPNSPGRRAEQIPPDFCSFPSSRYGELFYCGGAKGIRTAGLACTEGRSTKAGGDSVAILSKAKGRSKGAAFRLCRKHILFGCGDRI